MRARPGTDVPRTSCSAPPGPSRRRRTPRVAAILLACVALLFLSAAPSAGAVVVRDASAAWRDAPRRTATAHHGLPQVVLAQDDGLMLVGQYSALRGRPAPQLDSLTEAEAGAVAPLPESNVFFRGADCSWTAGASRFAAPVTLTFTLPEAIFSETALPLYRLDGHGWKRLTARARVGAVNTTASATITRPGRYALFLSRAWELESQDGLELVVYADHIPPTVLRDPHVTASGSTDDPAVITAVMQATGSTEEQALSTLQSFDSSTGTPVQVITLTYPTTLVRNWSGTSTVGRWFSMSDGGPLPSPETARRIYALPANNTGVNVTLHLIKSRVVLITGTCADMTAQSGYGPWATGGGEQAFGPNVSTYPPPVYDPAATVILSELRWEKSAMDAIEW